jgi:hypothetical protein
VGIAVPAPLPGASGQRTFGKCLLQLALTGTGNSGEEARELDDSSGFCTQKLLPTHPNLGCNRRSAQTRRPSISLARFYRNAVSQAQGILHDLKQQVIGLLTLRRR